MEYKALALKNAFLKRNACLCAPCEPAADRSICSAQSSQSPQTVQDMSRALAAEAMRHSVGDDERSTLGTHPFPSFVYLDLIHPK